MIIVMFMKGHSISYTEVPLDFSDLGLVSLGLVKECFSNFWIDSSLSLFACLFDQPLDLLVFFGHLKLNWTYWTFLAFSES